MLRFFYLWSISLADLTLKNKRFADEYLLDLNGTQAAIRSGYSAATANVQASRLLTNASITKYIQKALEKRSEATQIDAKYVLERLKQIDDLDVADIFTEEGCMLPILQWPKVWRISISGIDISEMTSTEGVSSAVLKKIKWPDKAKNLEMLGKHVNVQAWGDKKEDNASVLEDQLTEIMEKLSGNLPN